MMLNYTCAEDYPLICGGFRYYCLFMSLSSAGQVIQFHTVLWFTDKVCIGMYLHNCVDLMLQLLVHLDWSSVVAFSLLGFAYKKLAMSDIRFRVTCFLSFFIPRDHHLDFWKLLEVTNAVVFGGIVRAIMMCGNNSYYTCMPPQMDVAVQLSPLTSPLSCLWNDFLLRIEYSNVLEPLHKGPFDSCTENIFCYRRKVLDSNVVKSLVCLSFETNRGSRILLSVLFLEAQIVVCGRFYIRHQGIVLMS